MLGARLSDSRVKCKLGFAVRKLRTASYSMTRVANIEWSLALAHFSASCLHSGGHP